MQRVLFKVGLTIMWLMAITKSIWLFIVVTVLCFILFKLIPDFHHIGDKGVVSYYFLFPSRFVPYSQMESIKYFESGRARTSSVVIRSNAGMILSLTAKNETAAMSLIEEIKRRKALATFSV
jgi:hypothetical protein